MLERRAFLLGLSLATPLLARRRRAAHQAAISLDPGRLGAVAEVVLSSELDHAQRGQVVDQFIAWVRGYRAGAEILHGYGTGEVARTGPSPAPRWVGQLVSLDDEAHRRGAAGFARLSPGDRLAVIETALSQDRLDRLPLPIDARHVAIGLLAFYLQTPAAADLAYRAKIGKLTCRPLASNPARPESLG